MVPAPNDGVTFSGFGCCGKIPEPALVTLTGVLRARQLLRSFDSRTSLAESAQATTYHVPVGVPAGILSLRVVRLDLPPRSRATRRRPTDLSPLDLRRSRESQYSVSDADAVFSPLFAVVSE